MAAQNATPLPYGAMVGSPNNMGSHPDPILHSSSSDCCTHCYCHPSDFCCDDFICRCCSNCSCNCHDCSHICDCIYDSINCGCDCNTCICDNCNVNDCDCNCEIGNCIGDCISGILTGCFK